MGSSSKAEAAAGADGKLAPGFRFHPTDEELVSYYLKRKVCSKPFRYDPISEIDIYRSEPWDLPFRSRLKTRDLQWYFFSALDKKYGNSSRTNRATSMGYWKTTGKDRPVRHRSRMVGMKKTLVYHSGRAPRGQRTNWVMHEYRLEDDELRKIGIVQDAFVLCRIHQKSGAGPKNGEQYGAPFVEEEWDDDDVLVPKEETGVIEDPLFPAGGEKLIQLDGPDQHSDVAIRNDNVLPVMLLNGRDSLNNEPEPMGLAEEQHDQKLLDGAFLEELQQYPDFLEDISENNLQEQHPCAEYTPLQVEVSSIPNLPDKKAFGSMEENTNVSELFQMPITEESTDVKDVTNPVEADCPGVGELVEDDCTYFDVSYHDQPQPEGGCFLEFDDLLNPGEAYHASEFENLDDMLMYFDATDDNLASCDFEPILAPEVVGVTSPQKDECQEKPKPNTMEDATSSKQKLEEKTINDVHYEGGWDKSIAKQFTGMLGSISAPPAFAAEYGLQERIKSVGQNSNHSGSIHLTAGMFYISDRLTISSAEKPWSLQKGGNVEFLVSYGISGVDVMTEPNAEFPGKAMSMLFRAGLYLCFIWVPILTVSFKFGSFIYSK